MLEYEESSDIAVIGLAGRFPGAKNVNEFWSNLCQGKESISTLGDEEMLLSGIAKSRISDTNYVKSKGLLEEADFFGAEFFGYSPKEARMMDPQHRIFLEICYDALEISGHSRKESGDSIGVFASASFNTYLLKNLAWKPEFADDIAYYQMVIANSNDFLASRIAYKLNLNGPAQTIQTGCSSSLVAIHQARQSLLSYDCDMALAGGVSITTPLKAGYLYREGGISSPDGQCRPFDKQSKGTVPGNGAGVVVLKRLADAIEGQDDILSVIKGSAINNDGNNKVSYTAPSIEGQAKVVKLAQLIADVESETIGYIEAHGTGTKLGDPIEIVGLKKAFGVEAGQKCYIGSVKANIGHLDVAAGVTSLIKTTLMLHQKKFVPQVNFSSPNESLDLESSQFCINTNFKDWEACSTPRRAGVSSFGIGGTNVHMVLEEAPERFAKSNFDLKNLIPQSSFDRQSYWIDPQIVEKEDIVGNLDIGKEKSNESLEGQVVSIFAELLEHDSLDIDKDFDDLGADSLMLVDFQIKAEDLLALNVSSEDLENYRTIRSLVLYLEDKEDLAIKKPHIVEEKDKISYIFDSKQSAEVRPVKSSLVVNIRTLEAKGPVLFCIHPAGGSVTVFNEIAANIKTKIGIVGIRGLGWDGEEPDRSIEEMSDRYLKIIREIQPHGPYYFCGSSMGGVVAYDIAQKIVDSGEVVDLLAMLDSPAPTSEISSSEAPKNADEIFQYVRSYSPTIASNLQNTESRQPGYTKRFFRMWRAHAQTSLRYKAQNYNGNILYFAASEKKEIMPYRFEEDWVKICSGSIEIYKTDGNHLTMHSGSNAAKIAKILDKKIYFLQMILPEESYELSA